MNASPIPRSTTRSRAAMAPSCRPSTPPCASRAGFELVACKRSEDGKALILRLLNHAGRARLATVPAGG